MKSFLCLWLGVATLSAQVPPARAQAPGNETGNASIEGKVWDALTQEPVRKAVVRLDGRAELTAVTDASGQFAFRQLPAGRYFIQASSENYPFLAAPDSGRQASVSVTAAENKRGIELKLTPGGSVSGHIVDEEGNPLQRCTVSLARFGNSGMRQEMIRAATAYSDEKGEYHVDRAPAGKYYVQANCPQTVPLPHAFLRREDARNAPALVYLPMYYPAAQVPSTAARVPVAAGATVTGIDFRMSPATGFTVRGRAHPLPSDRFLIVQLQRNDGSPARWDQFQGTIDARTGDFRIPKVTRGSYELTVSGGGSDCSCYANVALQVGDVTPEVIDLPIVPAPRITGSVSVEGDTKVPLNRLRIMMSSVDNLYLVSQLQASVESDGSFALSAPPGRWRLFVNGAPGYIKSVMLGDQEVQAENLETGAAPASLKITIGTKNAQVDGVVSDPPAAAGSLAVVLWPARADSSVQQTMGVDPQGRFSLGVPPGRYYACAVPAIKVGMIYNNRPLRKGLESRCATVDAAVDNRATVNVPVLSADDLQHLQDALDDGPVQ